MSGTGPYRVSSPLTILCRSWCTLFFLESMMRPGSSPPESIFPLFGVSFFRVSIFLVFLCVNTRKFGSDPNISHPNIMPSRVIYLLRAQHVKTFSVNFLQMLLSFFSKWHHIIFLIQLHIVKQVVSYTMFWVE